MSSTQSIDQKLAKLILAPGQEAIPLPGLAASPDSLKKKVGPAPPPKVKKAQPQVIFLVFLLLTVLFGA